MEEGRDLRVGVLDILAVAQDKGTHLEENLASPGEVLGEWDRGQEEKLD